mmetsp:Transcript_17866/g.39183  ORF Transcript_17866/g.39183 Transcript_17866/m.39183 type:complete len:289 (-) Transcript_17866:269-1135(-)
MVSGSSLRSSYELAPTDNQQQMDNEEKVVDVIDRFRVLEDQGELDLYTCLSLRVGINGFCLPDIRRSLMRLGVLIALQFVVPLCLLSYLTRRFNFSPADQDWDFRICGLIMYLFSVWNMHDVSMDECRMTFLDFSSRYRVPSKYLFFAFLGEVISAFTGFSLVLSLFTVFCVSVDPLNLVINSLAINFVGKLDNDFADETLQKQCLKDFESMLINEHILHDDRGTAERKNPWEKWFFWLFMNMLNLVRYVGVLGLGHLLGVLFFMGNETVLCHHLHFLSSTKFCADVL